MKRIIQNGENEQVEFKSLLPKEKRNIGKKFIGMINSVLYNNLELREVYLFIGVNDDGSPCGIEPVIEDAIKKNLINNKSKKALQRLIINIIKDKSDPKIIPHSDSFYYDDYEILFFTCKVSNEVLVNYGGAFYIMAGDNITCMSSEMIKNYYNKILKNRIKH